MNLNPFVILICQAISLYSWVVVVYFIGNLLINFNVLNNNNKYVYKIMNGFSRLIEPALNLIRKYVPLFGGIDISYVILFLLLNFAKNVLLTYFYVR